MNHKLHKHVEGGNDYMHCLDCGAFWDYRREEPPMKCAYKGFVTFAIQWQSSDNKTFYRGMSAIGPVFGGTVLNCMQFASLEDAAKEKRKFSAVSALMSDIVELECECDKGRHVVCFSLGCPCACHRNM